MNALERLGLEVAAYQLIGSRTKAAVLCALLHANGRPLSVDRLAAVKPWLHQEITDARNVVKSRICLLRETLDDVGLGGSVHTCPNQHYAIPEPGRAKILERLIEVAA